MKRIDTLKLFTLAAIAVFLLGVPTAGRAQQHAHYSQYMFNNLVLNPAYAGSKGFASATALARMQWVGFPGAPKTQSFGIHAPTPDLRHGFGLIAANDALGPVSNTGVALQYAYRIPFGETAAFSLGLSGALDYFRTDFGGLNVEDPTDQNFGGTDVRRALPNAGFGMFFQNKRLYAGFSIPRLLQNALANPGTPARARQQRHYYLQGGALLDLAANVKFRPSFLAKYAGADGPQLDLNASLLFYERLWVGVSYRTEDAVVFLVEVWPTKQIRLGYAYDLNTSGLNTFNSGSHEFMLGFDFSFLKGAVVSPRYF